MMPMIMIMASLDLLHQEQVDQNQLLSTMVVIAILVVILVVAAIFIITHYPF